MAIIKQAIRAEIAQFININNLFVMSTDFLERLNFRLPFPYFLEVSQVLALYGTRNHLGPQILGIINQNLQEAWNVLEEEMVSCPIGSMITKEILKPERKNFQQVIDEIKVLYFKLLELRILLEVNMELLIDFVSLEKVIHSNFQYLEERYADKGENILGLTKQLALLASK